MQNKQWAKVDPSIYAQCFTGMALRAEAWCRYCHVLDHTSEDCPGRQMQSLPMKRCSPHQPHQPRKYQEGPKFVITSIGSMETAGSKIAVTSMSACCVGCHTQLPDAPVPKWTSQRLQLLARLEAGCPRHSSSNFPETGSSHTPGFVFRLLACLASDCAGSAC